MLDLIIKGGWALWIITACSIISLGITLERLRTLRKANVDSEDLLDELARHLEGGNVQSAIELCHRKHGPIAETLAIGLRKLNFLTRIGKKPEEIEQGIVEAMEDHSGHVTEYLERNLTALATVASLAPILGMMGTVVGMIRSFGDAAAAKAMTPDTVARGISEALLCTAGGLIVAAMATVEFNYFTTRVNRFVLQVQSAGTALVERVLDLKAAERARESGSDAGADRVAAAVAVAAGSSNGGKK